MVLPSLLPAPCFLIGLSRIKGKSAFRDATRSVAGQVGSWHTIGVQRRSRATATGLMIAHPPLHWEREAFQFSYVISTQFLWRVRCNDFRISPHLSGILLA